MVIKLAAQQWCPLANKGSNRNLSNFTVNCCPLVNTVY